MSFLNSAILLGLGLIAIPVILHFLLRQKPKRLLFPALRLVQARQRQSVRRLRLRHVWLMLLRMLLLAILILAIARPSLPAARYSLTSRELVTLLGVLASGGAIYVWLLRRLRHATPNPFQYEQARSTLRARSIATAAIVLLALVGWPYQRRIAAEIKFPTPGNALDLPVAGVMLFDTSLSMSYLEAGQTSLDHAQAIAKGHLQTLPPGSRIAVADTGADHPVLFQTTMLAAQTKIDALEPQPVSLRLDNRLRAALETQADDQKRILAEGTADSEPSRDRYLRRIYILTDLARSAWAAAGNSLLKSELARSTNINLYLVDLGREEPRDQAIVEAAPSSERIPLGGDLVVAATARSQGADLEQQQIDLLFHSGGGQTTRQGQAAVSLQADQAASTEFPPVTGLSTLWIQGEARLVGTDPLLFDNSRYFTVEVTEPLPVLVVAPERETAAPWLAALAPAQGAQESRNKFRPRFEPIGRLAELTLSDYPAITLINVPRLSDDAWFQLGKYVEEGGGLIVVLGHADISQLSYNRGPAQKFLPAQLQAWQPENDWSLSIDKRNHPLFSIFRRLETYNSFALMENVVRVFRFWRVQPAEGANVLATYSDSNRSPAILERSSGRGRTLLFTTSADLPQNYKQRWSNLASPLIDSWLFVAFVEQLTNYASQLSDVPHAFLTGQTAQVRVEPASLERTFLLKQPQLKQSRHVLPAGEGTLSIKNVRDPGHYELVAAAAPQTVLGGFSVNVPAEESDLTRFTKQELDDLLGVERYQIARNLQELKDDINAADLGQEVYPMLMALLVIAFCAELFAANRFYEASSTAAEGKSARRASISGGRTAERTAT